MKKYDSDAALNLIGMALRGGNAAVGREPVRDALRKGGAARVLLAEDAGGALANEMKRLCERYEVPITVIGRKADLGRVLGRAEVAVIALTERGLAEAVSKRTANAARRQD